MNREDEFELRLAEWLEDGPFAAPDQVVNAAIDHARGHPRRRYLPPVLGRIVMDGTHAAPAASRHTLHFGRAFAGGVAAVAIVAIVAVGAMLLVNRGTNNGPAAPTAKPGVSVTSTSAILGTLEDGTQSTSPDGIAQLRGTQYLLATKGSDPRIVGKAVIVLNEDTDPQYASEYNASFGPVETKVWGSITLTGPNGTWTGSYAGLIEGWATTSNRHWIVAVLLGTGDYAGFQYRYTQTSNDGTTFQGNGVIEPIPVKTAQSATNPQVMGKDTCEKPRLGAGATQKKAGVYTETRNASTTCRLKTTDARATATYTRTFNEDRSADGEFTAWGTAEIVSADGTWTGVWIRLFRVGLAGEGFVYIGSGAYAGLRYHGAATQSQTDPDTYVVGGAIEAAT